ncbi:MAG: bifunctional phosphopantothenoylcysteine decarboxylase/phosphopantothenate--cysteine ligase CoaBC [Gemmatimonadales bacterium]
MWRGRRVVLGVTGGIAAYKCVLLARELSRQGALVDVVLSRGAGEFVGAVTFEAVTRRPVKVSLWEPGTALDHVTLGQQADLVILAPATAQVISRLAQGVADDLLTTMLLAATAPVLVAPAMNDEMFANPATQSNVAALRARGWTMVGPAVGDLAEGPSERPGRMAEPAEIIAHGARLIHGRSPLTGRHVVVTAGPTREPIDPVRVITNRSSGKMGYRLAEAAWERGATVTLISGPSAEPDPVGVTLVRIATTTEMTTALRAHLPGANVLIMAAAPADYRTADPRAQKLPRTGGALSLELVPTDDILVGTLADRPAGLLTVGFALETGDAVAKAKDKLGRKHLDLIVVNDACEPGAGFEVDTNKVTILDRRGVVADVPLGSKRDVAEAILDAVERFHG